MFKLLTVVLLVSPAVMGQQAGTFTPEVHPKITWQKCQSAGHCSTVHGEVVLDAAYRWTHDSKGKACQNGDQWDKTICPDELTCAKNCALDGTQYESTVGVTTSGSALRQSYLTGNAVGSRIYLMANESSYELFRLLNQEFTFDVDLSTLPCGTNGALYLVAMEADGGTAKHPTNQAGAKYGTGYCDAQCPKGNRFWDGKANSNKYGACCAEMDLWEANNAATSFTAHPCNHVAATCTGNDCAANTECDSYGCGFNSYRLGNHSFYGPGETVDTKKVFTVVTQFISSDNTAHGDLTEIRRFYVQGGRVIPNSVSKIAGVSGNSLTDAFCSASHADTFSHHGGLKKMGEAIKAGMVLATALWDDVGGHMLWLDGTPSGSDPKDANGPCPSTGGVPAELHTKYPKAYITYSNIKVGAINSTFHA